TCPTSTTPVSGIGVTACLTNTKAGTLWVYAKTASIFILSSGETATQLKTFARDVVKTIGG
ncbi:MAG TPA: hypothetical protein VEJ21_03015, partial [Acidimicrobiales bacterium]|nr:hypothetical protein [Acidimicrobiales bacterium]